MTSHLLMSSTMQQLDLFEDVRALRDADCRRCILSEGPRASGRTICVPGDGPVPCDVMIVGRDPGANEEREGKPFVGQAGAQLDALLLEVGLRRDEVYVSNIVRCVAGSTAIRLPSPPTVGYRRYYEGPVIVIKTARGYELTVTPNHPILTQRGWVSAGELDPVCDSVYSPLAECSVSINPQVDEMPTSAENIFSTLLELGELRRIVGSVVDFHGDGRNGEVEIVRADSNLLNNYQTSESQRICNQPVTLTAKDERLLSVACAREPASGIGFQSARTETGTRLCSHSAPLLKSQATPIIGQRRRGLSSVQSVQGLGIVSDSDTCRDKTPPYHFPSDAQNLADTLQGFSSDIAPDNLVSVEQHTWSGHVYNFETSEGWYFANDIITHNCRPPGNREPAKEEIAACRSFTIREIALVKPKVIIALGGVTAKELMGKSKIQDARGKVHSLRSEFRYPCPVIVTYHPAAMLHSPNEASRMRAAIATDMQFALKLTRPPEDIGHVLTSFDPRAAKALDVLHRASELAVDLEWTVLPNGGSYAWSKRNGIRAEVTAIGAGAQIDGRLFALSVRTGDALFEPMFELVCSKPLILHNGPADLQWLLRPGDRDLGDWLKDDTLLLGSMLTLPHSLSLETLAGVLTEMPTGWKSATKANIGTRPVFDNEWLDLLERNARDCIATLLVRDALYRLVADLKRENLFPLYRELLRATVSLTRASLRGVPLDTTLLATVTERTAERIHLRRQQIAQELNVPGFATGAPKSGEQVAYALEALSGVRFPRTPKTHKPSLALGVLAEHQTAHSAIPKLISLAKLTKLHGTYFKPWDYLLREQGDGRLHTMYKLWAARSGRTSAENDIGGTLQQFPRAPQVRSLLRARDGCKIVSADMAQIELRIAAWIANEKTMLAAFSRGEDVHLTTALGVNVDAGIQSASMLLVQAGLQPNRAGAEILCALWTAAQKGTRAATLISACRDLGTHSETWRRERRGPDGFFQSVLERWSLSVEETSEEQLRALRQYAHISCAPQEQEPPRQPPLEHRDAVSLLSCARAWTLQEFPQWKELRQRAKATGFGFLYGMRERRFVAQAARDYGLAFTLEDATRTREGWFNLYPAFRRWHEESRKWLRLGYVDTPLGRRRPLIITANEDDESLLRKAINTPVQATASDLALISSPEIDLRFEASGLYRYAGNIGFVHDCLLFEVRDEYVADVSQIVKFCMEHPPLERLGIEIPVPLEAEIKVGQTWS